MHMIVLRLSGLAVSVWLCDMQKRTTAEQKLREKTVVHEQEGSVTARERLNWRLVFERD